MEAGELPTGTSVAIDEHGDVAEGPAYDAFSLVLVGNRTRFMRRPLHILESPVMLDAVACAP